MGDYTLEQKLAILEKMKQVQEKNHFSVNHFSKKGGHFHSKSVPTERTDRLRTVSWEEEYPVMKRSFGKLRFLFALFLLIGYFIIHFTDFSYKAFNANAVETIISDDFSIKQIQDLIKNFTK